MMWCRFHRNDKSSSERGLLPILLTLAMLSVATLSCRSLSHPKSPGLSSIEIRPYVFKDFHDSALSVAESYLTLFHEAQAKDIEASLASDIAKLQNTIPKEPSTPEYGIGFFPQIQDFGANPYITALYKEAEIWISEPEICYPLSKAGTSLFPRTSYNETRALGNQVEQLYFLVTHAQSRYRFHPKLSKILLCKLYATAYDYYLHGGEGLNIPGSTPNALDDWFAIGPLVYSWRMVDQSYGQVIPQTLRNFILASSKRAAEAVLKVPVERRYANRDISYAELLLQAGLYLKNPTYLSKSEQLLKQTYDSIYPDGAFPYIWDQNECVNYHAGNIRSFARIYASTANKMAHAGLTKLKNFEVLTVEPGNIGEYYTSPAWKTMWNSVSGIFGAEPVAALSKNPFLRQMIDLQHRQSGATASALYASYFDPNLKPKNLPDNYIVFDRNIEGPRARYQRFSYALTGRNVQPSGNQDPGHQTLVGAMITEDDPSFEQRRINSILLAVYPKVQVLPPQSESEWNTTAYLRSHLIANTALTKHSAAYTGTSQLQTQSTGPSAKDYPWASHEVWITLPDRLVGAVEVFPTQAVSASEVTGRIKFGYGRTGDLHPQQLVSMVKDKEFIYGQMKVVIHDHNFKTIRTGPAGVLRDSPQLASEIRLSDLSEGGSRSMQTYGVNDHFYFIVEIQAHSKVSPLDSVTYQRQGPLRSLVFTQGGKKYGAWLNVGNQPTTADLRSMLVPQLVSYLHGSQKKSATFADVRPTPMSVILDSQDLAYVVSSADAIDHEAAWKDFDALSQSR